VIQHLKARIFCHLIIFCRRTAFECI